MEHYPEKSLVGVVIPRPVPIIFTYFVPTQYREFAAPGCRVLVEFGKKQIITGIIKKFVTPEEITSTPKPILELLDSYPLLTPLQLSFYEWISKYYLCTEGEVMKAALTSGFRISTEAYVQLHPNYDAENLSENEKIITQLLQVTECMSINELVKSLHIAHAQNTVTKLIKKNVLLTFEEIKHKYKPSIAKLISINEKFSDENQLKTLLQSLDHKPAQQDVVLKILQLVKQNQHNRVEKSQLLAENISTSALNTLLKNNILIETKEIKHRINYNIPTEPLPVLTPNQTKSYHEILTQFETKHAVLLHGITGSGKNRNIHPFGFKSHRRRSASAFFASRNSFNHANGSTYVEIFW